MKYLVLATTTLLASPAFALQTPVPGKNDPHVCTVVYSPTDVLDVQAVAGRTVEIRFGDKERIANDGTGHVTVSDEAHLRMALAEGSNLLWLKATTRMEPQPILVRTLTQDGKPRDYVIQWTASSPPAQPNPNTQLASSAGVSVMEIQPTPPSGKPAGPNICYQISYLYPVDTVNANRAAWAAAAAKKQAEAAEIALHQQQDAAKNVRYSAQGDATIGPVQVSDDGMTTVMSFPGNLSIPVIYRINLDGTDGATIGITTEQGGVVRMHEVLPKFRLRQGDQVLCIFNHGYTQMGNNPGTGTTSGSVERDVHSP